MTDQIRQLSQLSRSNLQQVLSLAADLENRLKGADPSVDLASQAIFIKDSQGRITHHNRAFFPHLNDLVGKRSVDFVPDGIKGLSQLTDEFVYRWQQPVCVTHPNPFAAELTNPVATIKIPLLDASYQVRGLLGIIERLPEPESTHAGGVLVATAQSKLPMYLEIDPDLWREVQEAHAKLQDLSARQKSVVAMISAGLKQEAISRRLNISRKTVEKHREAASRKLLARNYAELIRMATLGQIVHPLEIVAPVESYEEDGPPDQLEPHS